MISSPASIDALKQSLKAWEGLHGKTLTPEAIDAWIETFKGIPYPILRRALQIVTARADRMPVPGFLTKAIGEAREEALHGAKAAEVKVPHISELPQADRDAMKRQFDETVDKIGLKYPRMRPEDEEREELARLERNRQKQAFAASEFGKQAQLPNSPSDAGNQAPATPLGSPASDSVPYEPDDSDLPENMR